MENSGEGKSWISREILKDLNTTRKWTMFLSILGFIGTGAFLVTGLVTGLFLSVFHISDDSPGFPEWLAFTVIILLTMLFLLPVLFLFRFSRFTSDAVRTKDTQKLRKAVSNLKAHYVYLGILLIVILALYFFVIISTMLSMGFVKNLG